MEAIEEEGRDSERDKREKGIGIRKRLQPVTQLGYFGYEFRYDGTDLTTAMRELAFSF